MMTPDIEAIIAERMAALHVAHKAMIEAQVRDTQAALDAEVNLYNQTQQAILNAQQEQLKREGVINEKIATLNRAKALRDSMFPPPTTPTAEAMGP